MRRTVLAVLSVIVMTTQLSLPVVLAFGIDPCAESADDPSCPPLGDDCHDCARCSPSPATIAALPAVVVDMIPLSEAHPTPTVAVRPPSPDIEPPLRVPRASF